MMEDTLLFIVGFFTGMVTLIAVVMLSPSSDDSINLATATDEELYKMGLMRRP